ncbi:LPS biosynthesis protein [Veronia nyctiphanis]|uniref:LPS-assembly lipoprotein LptE n=1 Tax=Veronia nyctiphanis TaxID=1278244 RepID=A0A4Q0YQ20_9GAMM|nr:LPS assembly lipoprotein LptE [Veronia nyctiphanis]RXJ73086.1 LPS biosynthesis protein [Veronia nyctiphanis]
MNSIFRSLRSLIVVVVALTTASCGFHLRGSYNLPPELDKLSVTSFDQYGPLTREMRYLLQEHGIKLTLPASNITNLHLISESYGERTLSLYQSSRVAEKAFTYTARYSVTVPGKGNYNFSASLNRSYLDNPLTALAKSVEQDMLAAELRTEATKQMMRQLTRIKTYVEEYEKKQAAEEMIEKIQNEGQDGSITIKNRFEGKDDSVLLPELFKSGDDGDNSK